MPKQNDSGNKKSRNSNQAAKRPRRFSERSEWSCWMNGADPEWFHTDQARALERVFGSSFPQWYIKASPWVEITPQRFQTMRKMILGLQINQCAAYLRVSRSSVSAWESGRTPIPFAAYEALRLQSETNFFKMSHQIWDGWYVQRQTGALISPHDAKVEILPHQLSTMHLTYAQLAIAEEKCHRQARRIDQLEAENARLRGKAKVRQVVEKLESMQATIANLLGDLHTAEIHEFPVAGMSTRAIAGA